MTIKAKFSNKTEHFKTDKKRQFKRNFEEDEREEIVNRKEVSNESCPSDMRRVRGNGSGARGLEKV